jgi:hypothetical protein
VLAPTTAAVEALREEGLPRAATVQRFLADEKFQHDARGSVVVVDEAGLLSGQDLLTLLEWSHAHRSRLLLSGDIRQHASIEAGDALRLLEARSTLRMIGVHGIRRQVDREYREAIADLARGHGLAGLTRLEKLGAVHEVREHERYQFLAADYVASVKAGKSALIVSPTWREIETVTGEVRARLKAGQLLGEIETAVPVHHALKWRYTHRMRRLVVASMPRSQRCHRRRGGATTDSTAWRTVRSLRHCAEQRAQTGLGKSHCGQRNLVARGSHASTNCQQQTLYPRPIRGSTTTTSSFGPYKWRFTSCQTAITRNQTIITQLPDDCSPVAEDDSPMTGDGSPTPRRWCTHSHNPVHHRQTGN